MASSFASKNMVVLVIESTKLLCDKKTLCENSDYFRAMLDGNFVEKDKDVIELKDVNVKALKVILKLLSDDKYPVVRDEDGLLEVLNTAVMLLFKGVADVCAKRLKQMLTVHNCLKLWTFTENLGIRSVHMIAKFKALEHFEQVKGTDGFLELKLDQVFRYLANRNLNCGGEHEVFEAAMEWYAANCAGFSRDEEDKAIFTLLTTMDWNSLSEEEMAKIKDHHVIVGSPEIQAILTCLDVIKRSEEHRFDKAVVIKAELLRSSQSRKILEIPFFSSYTKSTLLETLSYLAYKPTSNKFETKVFPKINKAAFPMDGYKLFSQSEYIFLVSKFKPEFWIFDSYREEWKKQVAPINFTTLEWIICGKYLYVFGSRNSENYVVQYDIIEEQWSMKFRAPHIKHFCEYRKQLFVLDLLYRKVQICQDVNTNSTDVKSILNNDLLFPLAFKNFVLFSQKDKVYIRGNRYLIETSVKNGKFATEKSIELSNTKGGTWNDVKYIICGSTLFTLYRRLHYPKCYEVGLEMFCLKTYNPGLAYKKRSSSKLDTFIFKIRRYDLVDRYVTTHRI